ncbi:hypothetical protein O3P69_020116 [Scylla paramamosain]|uniref:Uncharacterized protein n=1 Tax=Scylla paramamosain TaxID=85552 RepID=A0AAW0TMZ0_SCYPA
MRHCRCASPLRPCRDYLDRSELELLVCIFHLKIFQEVSIHSPLLIWRQYFVVGVEHSEAASGCSGRQGGAGRSSAKQPGKAEQVRKFEVRQELLL